MLSMVYIKERKDNGKYVIRHDGDTKKKKEKSFLYLIAFITIFFTGPGKYSIDKK